MGNLTAFLLPLMQLGHRVYSVVHSRERMSLFIHLPPLPPSLPPSIPHLPPETVTVGPSTTWTPRGSPRSSATTGHLRPSSSGTRWSSESPLAATTNWSRPSTSRSCRSLRTSVLGYVFIIKVLQLYHAIVQKLNQLLSLFELSTISVPGLSLRAHALYTKSQCHVYPRSQAVLEVYMLASHGLIPSC